ncbi:MAG TPA: hypothetical protein VJ375_01055 [Gaiellaceae bacterium]|jgi:hypothetical protein|nr:hypothetical protein [Gaiellaceae bacterium]
MKARLIPLYLTSPDDPDFVAQVGRLRELLAAEAELLAPLPLGAALPEADAVVFPQLVGDAYRRVPEIRALTLPILVLTSEFGTMAMWDWEIVSYLRTEGVETIAPYSLAGAATVCRALVAKRELRGGKFLVYQDRPGEGGFQPSIFKRFYWWEDECAERMRDVFGLTIVKRSFEELGRRAQELPDDVAREEWERWRERVPLGDVGERATLSALKLYRAVRDDLDAEGGVLAAGINCLNESAFSDTTPCLAWNLLYQERDLIWGCEGDTVSMLTKLVLHRSLRTPVIMSNLYPFLMGQTALKHERIPAFPEVDEPDNYVLAAHCGYLGVVPQPFATDWKLRGKVLAIVDDNATAIDARLPVGDLTLAKLDPTLRTLVVVEGRLTGYAGYPGSDCLNGAVIRVPDGHVLMERLPSHHSLLTVGHDRPGLELLGRVFGLTIERPGA